MSADSAQSSQGQDTAVETGTETFQQLDSVPNRLLSDLVVLAQLLILLVFVALTLLSL